MPKSAVPMPTTKLADVEGPLTHEWCVAAEVSALEAVPEVNAEPLDWPDVAAHLTE